MNKRYSEGITLIALVITIIILLILAGLSIQILAGENGLIERTVKSKQAQENAEEKELIELAVSTAQIDGNGTITTTNLNNALQETFNNDKDARENEEGWDYEANKKYNIYPDGRVEDVGNVESILPIEYQQVEYIESTGGQYIDTKYIANNNTGFYIKFNIQNQIAQNSGVTGYLIGCRTNLNNTQIKRYQLSTWQDYNGGMLAFDTFDINNSYNPKIIPGKTQEIKLKNKILTDGEGITQEISNYNFVCDGSLYLLCCKVINENNSTINLGEYAKAKLYNVEIYNNNDKVRNYIPCYSTTTVTDIDGKQCPAGTVGLYDTVEGKFYTNKGTGTFLKGNNV